MLLKDRVAIVTGASSGIGARIAEALAAEMARVVVAARSADKLAALVERIEAAGGTARAVPADMTDEAQVEALFATCAARFGAPRLVVNNAGIADHTPTVDLSLDRWRAVIDANLTSVLLAASAAMRAMIAAGGGRIINTASLMGVSSRPGVVSYVAAKHGVVGLTRALAAELGPFNITVNAIGPGYIETEINKATLSDGHFHKTVVDRTPLGRWASPDELAAPAVFLASPGAAFVSGHVLMIDGGMSASLFLVESSDLGLAS